MKTGFYSDDDKFLGPPTGGKRRGGRRRLREAGATETRTHKKLEEATGILREAEGNRAMIEIISPGWGSSGYYSREVIERDIPKIYPPGSHMYIDHPTLTEEYERPERSVKDLAAETTGPPVWNPVKEVMEAPAKLFDDWAQPIKEKASAIGVSIYAGGWAESGTAEGREGPIVQELDEGVSIDFVTKAGRGGKVAESKRPLKRLLESARRPVKETLDSTINEGLRNAGVEKWGARDTYVYVEDYDTEEKYVVYCVSPDDGENEYYQVSYAQNSDDEITLGDDLQQVERVAVYKPVTESTAPAVEKEDDMDEESKKRLSELEDQVRQQGEKLKEVEDDRDEWKTKAERAEDKVLSEAASRVVSEALSFEDDDETEEAQIVSKLPERALERVKESALGGKTPVDEDGKLDKDKLIERVRKASKEEYEYLNPDKPDGSRRPVRGFGSHSNVESQVRDDGNSDLDTQDDPEDEELAGIFERRGMSESAAKVAAKGR